MKKNLLAIVLVITIFKVEAQTSTFTKVDSLLNRGRYQSALKLLKEQPSTFETNKKIASIYNSLENIRSAAFYYEEALKIKESFSASVKLGAIYVKQKKLSAAIKIYEKLHGQDKDNLFVAYQLGKLYVKLRKAKKALRLFQELIEKDNSNANYHYYKGMAFKLLKQRDPKMNSFLDAYERDDTHMKSIENLAVDYLRIKDRDSSAIFVNQGLLVNPNHLELNKLKINDLYREKKFEDALVLLQRIDSIKPNELYTKKMLGRTYFKLKDFEKARECFKKAGKIDRNDYKVYTYLGDIEFEEENFKRADLNYGFATFIGKESRDTEYYKLGLTAEKLKEPKNAIFNYEKAIKENRRNYRSLYQLAVVTEHFYEDKRIAYKHYKTYIERFKSIDRKLTSHAEERLKVIKKHYFKQGEILE